MIEYSFIQESTYDTVDKKCKEINFTMDEWYKKLQRYGDKEAFVSTIDSLRDKIGDMKDDIKRNPELGNSVLYVPDNSKLLSVARNNIADLTDDIISYMKKIQKIYSMSDSDRDNLDKVPDKIERMMDDFDRLVDNCYVTKRTATISGYLVMTDDMLDIIEDIMEDGIVESLIETTNSYCTKYLNSLDTLTRYDMAIVESVFKLIRSFCGSMRLYVGKSYGNICTNAQRIYNLLKE